MARLLQRVTLGRVRAAAIVAALTCAALLAAGTLRAADTPPVYLDDPGLAGFAVKPDYISFKTRAQTLTWIRDIHWHSWGSETALGTGKLEICTFGRCTDTSAKVRLWRRRPRHCPTGSSYTRISYVAGGHTTTRTANAYVCENA
jgi:hypothetical protein